MAICRREVVVFFLPDSMTKKQRKGARSCHIDLGGAIADTPAPLLATLAAGEVAAGDADALLAAKAALEDPTGSLASSSTNATAGPCEWSGVSCDARSGAVVGIDLSGSNLSGAVSLTSPASNSPPTLAVGGATASLIVRGEGKDVRLSSFFYLVAHCGSRGPARICRFFFLQFRGCSHM